jgi:hypothetical protein
LDLPSFKDVLDRVTSPGDIATVLIFGVAGYTIDAGLNAVGFMEPGIVGNASALGALGVKKAWESRWRAWQLRRSLRDVRERAEHLRALLDDGGRRGLAIRMATAINVHDKKIHAAPAEKLQEEIELVLSELSKY